MLGIIGAMDSEVQELKNEMPDAKITSVAGMDFYEGHIHDKDVVVVKCGIGKVNAAICTQILADRYKVDSVINTGVAGSLNSDIDICDIVISKDAIEHDMDVTALGYERGVIPDMDNSVFHSDSRLIDVAVKSIEEANLSVKVFTGRVVSGDQFIAGKEKKDRIMNEKERNIVAYHEVGHALATALQKNTQPVIARILSIDHSNHKYLKSCNNQKIQNAGIPNKQLYDQRQYRKSFIFRYIDKKL